MHAGKFSRHIGLQVAAGVFEFVEQLRGREAIDAPPGARQLGDHTGAIGLHLGQRKAHLVQPGNVHKPRVSNVAATDLGRAPEQMADHDALPQALPVVRRPAKAVHERRQEQRRVGHTPRDHDIGAGLQRGQQGIRAEVGVGRDQAPVQ